MTTDLEDTLLWNSPCILWLILSPFWLVSLGRASVLDTSRKDLMKEQFVTMQALPCQLILEVPLLLGATTLSEQGQG